MLGIVRETLWQFVKSPYFACMKSQAPLKYDEPDGHFANAEQAEQASEADPWFLSDLWKRSWTICLPGQGQSRVKPQSSTRAMLEFE
jgi:hypothetical protein